MRADRRATLARACFRISASRSVLPFSTRCGSPAWTGARRAGGCRRNVHTRRSSMAAPFAAIWWHADASVWPYALASAIFEAIYVSALAYAYRVTDVSFVYPATRGLAPVMRARRRRSPWLITPRSAEVGGVVLVGVGVVLVRGLGGRTDAQALLARGDDLRLDRRVHVDRPSRYPACRRVDVLPARDDRPLSRLRPVDRRQGDAEGAGARGKGSPRSRPSGSLMLGLLALRHGAAAPVLAVRSSSIVTAALFARRFVAEHVSWSRVAGTGARLRWDRAARDLQGIALGEQLDLAAPGAVRRRSDSRPRSARRAARRDPGSRRPRRGPPTLRLRDSPRSRGRFERPET